MLRLDISPATPAENLAVDEALLDWCDAGFGDEILHFWEPRETFVVVGYANKVATEVNTAICGQKGIPVYRRCSGGGTVVQMPGVLNYSLILRIGGGRPTQSIASANKYIMENNRKAVEMARFLYRLESHTGLRREIHPPLSSNGTNAETIPGVSSSPGDELVVSVRGYTDLCLGDLKFSGNAQRRRKHFLLFHGTLLLDCDLGVVSDLLLMPSLQPDYRKGRCHADFITNIELPGGQIKTAFANIWGAYEVLKNPPYEAVVRLANEKYATREWNWKF